MIPPMHQITNGCDSFSRQTPALRSRTGGRHPSVFLVVGVFLPLLHRIALQTPVILNPLIMPKLSLEIPPIRLGLYVVLALFSFVLFCLTAVRLNYTTQFNFYESYVAELIFTGIITMAWCIFVIVAMFKRFEFRFLTTFLGEIIVLVILWFFWIIGAGIASSSWQGLEGCQRFEPCRVLSALLGFAWLSWLTLTALLIITVLFSVANHALQQPLHGRWDPRISMYSS